MFDAEDNVVMHGSRYYCPNCGRNYNRKANLNRHMNLECGVPKKFSCRTCGKAFTRNNELTKHVLIVHKEGILNMDQLTYL